jgi:hypothetical protein
MTGLKHVLFFYNAVIPVQEFIFMNISFLHLKVQSYH